MTLAVRALQTADAQAYKYARLLALKTEPSTFTSALETTQTPPDQHLQVRASFKQWGLESRALQLNDEYYDEVHMAMITT